MKIQKRAFTFPVLCLVLIMCLTQCVAQPTIYVGFSGSISGKDALMGIDGRDGALLAVDTLNAEGGVLGKRMELVIRDDQGSPEGVQAANNALIQFNVTAIVGHMTSTATLAGLEVTQPAGMIMISPTASTTSLKGKEDLFFRLITTADIEAHLIAQRVRELGFKTAGIILDEDNEAYVEAVLAAFEEKFPEIGGQVTEVAPFSSQTNPDFRPLLDSIRKSGAETLLVIAGAQDTGIICQHTRMIGWNAPIFTARWGQGDVMIRDGGHAADGVETVIDFDPNNSSPEYTLFQNNFRTRFNREPTFAALRGYEAILLLARALEKTNGESQGLPQALTETGRIDGPAGPFELDQFGDVIRQHYLLRVENGAWVTNGIYPP